MATGDAKPRASSAPADSQLADHRGLIQPATPSPAADVEFHLPAMVANKVDDSLPSAITKRMTLPDLPVAAWREGMHELLENWRLSANAWISKKLVDGPVLLTAPTDATAPAVGPSDNNRATAPVEGTTLVPGQAVDSPAPRGGLTLCNPFENHGPIRFLVNRRVFELYPGETHQFPASDSWHISFHRGGDFGNAELTVVTGTFRFVVTSDGWDLVDQFQP